MTRIRVFCLFLFAVFYINHGRAADGNVKLIIGISGVRGHAGTVNLAVFATADGFPGKPEKAVRKLLQPIREGEDVRIEVMLPEGRYAIAAYHDENSDGKLNTNFFGAPTEGIGFSNGRVAKFGPPSFDDCALTITGAPVKITMRY